MQVVRRHHTLMQRPWTVVTAIVLLGISLAYSSFSELNWIVLRTSNAQSLAFSIGQASFPIILVAFQIWLLSKIWSGRNWARLFILVIVLGSVLIKYFFMQSAFVSFLISPIIIDSQTVVDVVAVILLLMSGGFFEKTSNAA